MSAPDFAAAMATWELFTADDGEHGVRIRKAAGLLAAKVPELCPTCDGSGHAFHLHGDRECRRTQCFGADGIVRCPDCPTIGALLAEAVAARELARTHGVTPAKLLTIGAAVMADDWHVVVPTGWLLNAERVQAHAIGAEAAVAYLRAVQP